MTLSADIDRVLGLLAKATPVHPHPAYCSDKAQTNVFHRDHMGTLVAVFYGENNREMADLWIALQTDAALQSICEAARRGEALALFIAAECDSDEAIGDRAKKAAFDVLEAIRRTHPTGEETP